MGSIVKRTWRTADGKLHTSRRWYARFQDGSGRWRMEVAYSDRRATEKMLGEREDASERGESNFGDPYREHRAVPLATHVEDFITHLEAAGVCPAHRNHVRQYLDRAFGEIGPAYPGDVTTEAVEAHLIALLQPRPGATPDAPQKPGASFKTRNHVLATLSQFFKWGVEAGRWGTNPAAGIKPLRAESDPRRRRRPLTVEELQAVVEAAKTRPRAKYLESHPNAPADLLARLNLQGQERSTLYLLAATVGLRRNELRLLRWADLSLDAETSTVTVRAETAKAKRTDTLPMLPELAAALKAWREGWARLYWQIPAQSDPVFRCVTHGLLEAFERDCGFAGVEVETTAGRVDLHSLRHTCATFLCRAGVSVRTTQSLMRHIDPRTTMRIYAHVQGADRVDAVAKLGSLMAPKPEAKAVGNGQ
jgi:integrase